MVLKKIKTAACMMTLVIVVSGNVLSVSAASSSYSLPAAGLGLELEEGIFVKDAIEQSNTSTQSKSTSVGVDADLGSTFESQTTEQTKASMVKSTDEETADETDAAEIEENTEEVTDVVSQVTTIEVNNEAIEIVLPVEKVIVEKYADLVIAQVNDYVNVRSEANTDSEIVGKLYDNSVGTLLQEVDGWYQIQSGECIGFVSAEYCVTGNNAIDLVEEIATRIAVVNTDALRVREEASTDSAILGMVSINDELIVTQEDAEWIEVEIEEGYGFIAAEYVDLTVEYVEAESTEQEEARLAAEQAERDAANAAAAAQAAANAAAAAQSTTATTTTTASGSGLGTDVANYALQFVGNPYVYGGTSLTNGADCSGFVMSVYANFGVSLPHSSAADRSVGYDVGGLENAQPGDIICYSGHVGIYIGNGQIVHASTSKTGIIVGSASYRTVLAVRRIF